MIFLTLGTQLPFDRLVKALDDVAGDFDETVFGQIGRSSYTPQNFEFEAFLSPQQFDEKFSAARVIVGHAGIGTILSGMSASKPLILMPRLAKFGEHRNDHQIATVSQMRKLPGVYIVENSDDLRVCLADRDILSMKSQASTSRDMLISNLREEIFKDFN